MPEKLTFHIQELIAAAAFIITGGGLGTIIAKNRGWITFGQPSERRNCRQQICDEHSRMVIDLSKITSEITDLQDGQRINNALLHDIAGKVDRLVGYHQGRNGVNLGG